MVFTPELLRYKDYKKPRSQSFGGSLRLYGDDGGMARKPSTTNLGFSKTGSYTICFWVKFDADDTRTHTLVRLGNPSVNGWRIVKTKNSGRHVMGFQEFTTFTSDMWLYPKTFDPTQWHHVAITIVGNSETSVTTQCYINGRELRRKLTNVSWTPAVALSAGQFILGSDYSLETLLGNINYVGFWNQLLYPTQIFKNMWTRNFKDAVSVWRCDENGGTTIRDIVGDNDLTIASPGKLKFANQSWPPAAGQDLDPSELELVDFNMGFNYGNNAQSGTGFYTPEETATHLTFLSTAGVDKLRVPFASADYPDGMTVTTAQLEQICDTGDFYVIAVGNPTPPTDSTWDECCDQIKAQAAIAYAAGANEFNIANEIDGRETNDHVLTNSVPKQIALAEELIALYDGTYPGNPAVMVISTAILQSSLDYLGAPNGWIANASFVIASGMKLGYNCYGDNGDFVQFQERIQDLYDTFGSDILYISEWNVNATFEQFPPNINDQNDRIEEKLLFLQSLAIKHYFFTFYWPFNLDRFALLKGNDEWRLWYQVLFNEI